MPVAPSDTASGYASAAQVDAFQAAGVEVDLEHRLRRGHAFDLVALDFHREHRPLRPLVEIRAHRRRDEVRERPQYFVIDEVSDIVESTLQIGLDLTLDFGPLFVESWIEARLERSIERPRRIRVRKQNAVDRLEIVVRANLLEVRAKRP